MGFKSTVCSLVLSLGLVFSATASPKVAPVADRVDPGLCSAMTIPANLAGSAKEIRNQCVNSIKSDGSFVESEMLVLSKSNVKGAASSSSAGTQSKIRIRFGVKNCGCRCLCIQF